jgi:hypothetical protein
LPSYCTHKRERLGRLGFSVSRRIISQVREIATLLLRAIPVSRFSFMLKVIPLLFAILATDRIMIWAPNLAAPDPHPPLVEKERTPCKGAVNM